MNLIAWLFFDNRSTSNSGATNKSNDTIRSNAPHKIKCRCTKCCQIIMVPKQYLKDLSYHDPQTSKCPKCGMTKVEIIQTWGLH